MLLGPRQAFLFGLRAIALPVELLICSDKLSQMPPSDIEQKITQAVIYRFIVDKEPTQRK